MTNDPIWDEAAKLQQMAMDYPNPLTKAVLMEASAMLFRHIDMYRSLGPNGAGKGWTPEIVK